MTPDLSPAEAATLARIEAAPYADESAVERVARVIAASLHGLTPPLDDDEWEYHFDEIERADFRDAADAALRAVAGPDHHQAADDGARDRITETLWRCLDRALEAMNRAVEITTADGPAVAMEFIADYLNNTDSIDEAIADATPDDWLTRWHVSRAAGRREGREA